MLLMCYDGDKTVIQVAKISFIMGISDLLCSLDQSQSIQNGPGFRDFKDLVQMR